MDVRKNFPSVRMVKPRNKLPGGAAGSPSVEFLAHKVRGTSAGSGVALAGPEWIGTDGTGGC